MHPLGRLIAQRMDHPDHRWSVRDVERRAREQGESLTKSAVSAFRNEMTPSITRANVFGLAAGLGVTPLTVANAALQSWGIETRPVEVTDSLATIAIDPTLSERDKRQLRALIDDMRENSTTKGTQHAVETPPKPDASSEGDEGKEAGDGDARPASPDDPKPGPLKRLGDFRGGIDKLKNTDDGTEEAG